MRFLSWECWDFWKRHDHFRIFSKKSEVFEEVRSLPKTSVCDVSGNSPRVSQAQSIYAYKHKLALSAFHFKNQRSQGRYCHLFIFHMVFVPYMGLSLHIFGNCVKQEGNNSHFSIRREKLARKHEPAWDRSFQPAAVRLTLKAWELAGIRWRMFVVAEAQNIFRAFQIKKR